MIQSGNCRTAVASLCVGAACRRAMPRAAIAQEADAAGEIEARQAEKQAELDRVSPRDHAVRFARRGAGWRDRRHQEGPRQHNGGADPGRQDGAQAWRGHRGNHRQARGPEGAPGGDPPVARRPARRARRSAGRAAADGPQPAARLAGQAGGRAVVGAQRHPARRRGAGTARADRGAARRPQGTVARHRLDRGRARQAGGDGRRTGRREEAARPAARRKEASCRTRRRPPLPANGRRPRSWPTRPGA